MKDKNNIIISLIILFYVIVLEFVFVAKHPENVMFINFCFWLFLALILYRFKGIKKDKREVKRSTISIVIIWVLLYTLVSFISGLYLGFLKNSFSLKISSIIINIYSLVMMIIAEEYIKDIIIRKKNNRFYLVIITILFIVIDIVLLNSLSGLTSNLKIFLFVTGTLIPVAIRNVLSSYMVYNFGIIPSIIYRIYFTIYPYIFPIYPDLGLYLSSVIGVLLPYLIYLSISRIIDSYEDKKSSRKSKRYLFTTISLVIVLIIVVILVSGVFKYKIISIASGSMNPYIGLGDAIIYEKIDYSIKLKKGDVIVFKHNALIITHRIYEVEHKNGKHYYVTKGDNNASVDDYIVEEKDIIGILRLRIKYIGIPSLWFNELFN